MPKEYTDQYMKKCAVCGKDIYVPCADNWLYKRAKTTKGIEHRLWLCSYHCTREWDRRNNRGKV